MGVIPIACSMLVTYLSAIQILGMSLVHFFIMNNFNATAGIEFCRFSSGDLWFWDTNFYDYHRRLSLYPAKYLFFHGGLLQAPTNQCIRGEATMKRHGNI